MSEIFMAKENYRELLQDAEGVNVEEFLKLRPDEEFLVEVHFLNYWNDEYGDRPNQEGIDLEIYTIDNEQSLNVYITSDKEYVPDLCITYTPDTAHAGQHELTICCDDNLVYWRTANQNPATEWKNNEMANNYKVDGKIVFVGDPVQI